MSKHTPGPWSWTEDDHSMATLHGKDYLLDHVMSASPCRNCQKEGESPFGKCTMPNIANARLISAAPDLLEALEGLLKRIDEINPPNGPFWSGAVDQEKARAAIAKAKGEQR